MRMYSNFTDSELEILRDGVFELMKEYRSIAQIFQEQLNTRYNSCLTVWNEIVKELEKRN